MDDAEAAGDGRLHAVNPDWTWTIADSGYRVANGPTFSRGGRFVYHTDSAKRLIYRFERVPGGRLEGKEILIRFEESWGYPDGMTTDAEGCLWVAHWDGGRVSRFSPEGTLERSIELPVSRVTSCCFAGPNLDRMFVTTASVGREEQPMAGALFEIDPGVKGLPSTPFPG
jgi:sugar lactone lactonase YvrE